MKLRRKGTTGSVSCVVVLLLTFITFCFALMGDLMTLATLSVFAENVTTTHMVMSGCSVTAYLK